ncbi:hypothetical protein FQA39_LY04406 [Lamprigera yunnana]|nr:hypothetical protein FQA39_LY04406 [Lamprigera yunnana]
MEPKRKATMNEWSQDIQLPLDQEQVCLIDSFNKQGEKRPQDVYLGGSITINRVQRRKEQNRAFSTVYSICVGDRKERDRSDTTEHFRHNHHLFRFVYLVNFLMCRELENDFNKYAELLFLCDLQVNFGFSSIPRQLINGGSPDSDFFNVKVPPKKKLWPKDIESREIEEEEYMQIEDLADVAPLLNALPHFKNCDKDDINERLDIGY